MGQIDSIFCSQDGQALELGFSDVLPFEWNGPDVVVYDGRTFYRDMLIAVRPVGDDFGELVHYGPEDTQPTVPYDCPSLAYPQYALGVDFERHGLLPGTVVDRIRIVADCTVTPAASEYIISMAAVVDRSCVIDDDCDDQNECTTDFCGDDGFCKFDPDAPSTPCEGGFCDGVQIPHCLACLDDSDCSGPTPVCHPFDAVCVACVYDSDCGAPTALCDWETSSCVPCLSGLQCDDGNECTLDTCDHDEGCHSQLHSKGTLCSTGLCDGNPEGPACVECLGDEDCPEAEPHCRESDRSCVACRNDGDCNDFIVCTKDICASGSCFSYDESGQCAAEGGRGGGGGGASTALSGAGGGGDPASPDDGCDCRAGSRSSGSIPGGLLAALALAWGLRRQAVRSRQPASPSVE